MTRLSAVIPAVVLFAAISCTRESQPPPPAPTAPPLAKAQAIPATPAPVTTESRDALRAAYDTALADLRQYQGDRAVLERARTAFTQLVNRDRSFALGYVGLAKAEYYAG